MHDGECRDALCGCVCERLGDAVRYGVCHIVGSVIADRVDDCVDVAVGDELAVDITVAVHDGECRDALCGCVSERLDDTVRDGVDFVVGPVVADCLDERLLIRVGDELAVDITVAVRISDRLAVSFLFTVSVCHVDCNTFSFIKRYISSLVVVVVINKLNSLWVGLFDAINDDIRKRVSDTHGKQ